MRNEMLPITAAQRRRAVELLAAAESAIRILCSERLNIDAVARAEINLAGDCVLAAGALIQAQPLDEQLEEKEEEGQKL